MEYTINDLKSSLWAAADEMRKVMSADVYKDYLLGLVFYKALSDKVLVESYRLVNDDVAEDAHISLDEAQKCYEQSLQDPDLKDDLKNELQDTFGCFIEPELTFTYLYNKVNNKIVTNSNEIVSFKLDDLRQAFRNIEAASGGVYSGLFDDFDTDSKDLGKTPAKRNEMISSVIALLAAIDFSRYPEDALGDAYEYLIAQFASESGKKAGEFYTPQAVSELMARFVTHGQNDKYGFSVYDPCCGSGSLLLQIRNYIVDGDKSNKRATVEFYGQELKNQTYNLARMNMMLHRIAGDKQHLRNGDALDGDWPSEGTCNFDAVVMNPPYSQKYDAKESLLSDARFSPYQSLPPATKADYAFLLQGLYHLKDSGTMAIVLPHGVLFRGASEAKIRKTLVDKGNIYAVIGLPAGIFFNTGIPTCIIVLKKEHNSRNVLFIDASQDFFKDRAKNYLLKEHVDKIFKTFVERKDVEKYAHLASYEEIVQNDYNLNIPRYVDSVEEEAPVDLDAAFAKLQSAQEKEQSIDTQLAKFFKELGLQGGK